MLPPSSGRLDGSSVAGRGGGKATPSASRGEMILAVLRGPLPAAAAPADAGGGGAAARGRCASIASLLLPFPRLPLRVASGRGRFNMAACRADAAAPGTRPVPNVPARAVEAPHRLFVRLSPLLAPPLLGSPGPVGGRRPLVEAGAAAPARPGGPSPAAIVRGRVSPETFFQIVLMGESRMQSADRRKLRSSSHRRQFPHFFRTQHSLSLARHEHGHRQEGTLVYASTPADAASLGKIMGVHNASDAARFPMGVIARGALRTQHFCERVLRGRGLGTARCAPAPCRTRRMRGDVRSYTSSWSVRV